MLPIFDMIRKWFRGLGIPTMRLKDKVASVEIQKRYGTLDWAQRHPKTQHDIDAPKVNANVYIATRAISDAIKGLPVNIVETEVVNGVEREIDDNEHPANELLRNPNPEHTWSDVVSHIVKSYLTDGNALCTIERMTGPNPHLELWPRDPRCVDINTKNRSYRFGVYTTGQKTYPRNRVMHIRDMDVSDPFWGVGRITTIREEILMDYFINRFNSNFFKFGATLNLMFTPDHNLTEDQHTQILDAMSSEIGGADKAFRIFINRYAGKFESPEQKHKDIAFEKLLKSNREKIFGVFGLPPFRGGVMEYANYANALAQDKDFWINTIAPILKVIEDAFNKQVLWPFYGPDIRIKFDLDSVPAIKGDQTDIENRLIALKNAGVVSPEYVREQLGIEESAAPVDTTESPFEDDAEPVDDGTSEEQEEVEGTVFKLMRQQRVDVLSKLSSLTCGGSMMSVLCDSDTQATRVYNPLVATRSICHTLEPVLHKILQERGTEAFRGIGVFEINRDAVDQLLRQVTFRVETAVDQNIASLRSVLDDADRYGWTYRQLEKRVRSVFSYERSQDVAHAILASFISNITERLSEMRNLNRKTPDNIPQTVIS